MSGICAVWRRGASQQAAETLASLTGRLSPAADADTRREVDQDAGVGLAARFETQQIYRNSRVLIACDANLYNEAELSKLTGADQAPPDGKTAALLAALYERFGCDFVEKLDGSFSLVLWDRRERKLIAAVDRFAMNRLAYYQDGNTVMVATRVDAIACATGIDLQINPRAITSVLNFSSILAPETIFTAVQRLTPGTLLVASDQHTRVEKYWDMRYGVKGDSNEERLSRKLESVVEQAVAAHCKGEPFGNLGAFLSGGTDSSTVVGMMSRMDRGPAKAFSIGFQEQPFNELSYARIAAQKFRADHYTYLVGPDDCFEALPRMVRSFDEPFGNSSAIATYFCARLAAQHGVKVLLAGDGGDELFGGNERYATDKIFSLYHKLPAVLRKGLIEAVLDRVPVTNGLVGRARGYVRRANMPGVERLLSFQFLATHSLADVFDGDFLKTLSSDSIFEIPGRHYQQAPARDHLDRLLYVDVKITLGDNDLPKVTCMSELAGIQVRFPFLDQTVAEFSGCIPPRLKVKGFQKRYLFKRAFRDLLPTEVIQKKKHGFGIPVAPWLKTHVGLRELAHDVLLSQRAFERGYFRRAFIEELFRKHEADDSNYYGDTLWTFLALELWHRQFVDETARTLA